MSVHAIRMQTLAALLAMAFCGCSVVGMGYRAGHTRGTARAEAARLSKLARLYERQGHPDGALRLYRQALHTDPRSEIARERLMALSSRRAVSPRAPVAPTNSPTTAIASSASPARSGAAPTKPVESLRSVPPKPTSPPVRTATAPQVAEALPVVPAAPVAASVAKPEATVAEEATPPPPVKSAEEAVVANPPAPESVTPQPLAATALQATPLSAATSGSAPGRQKLTLRRVVPRTPGNAPVAARRAPSQVPALTDLLAASAASSEAPASLSVSALPLPAAAPQILPSAESQEPGWAATRSVATASAASSAPAHSVAEVQIRPRAHPSEASGVAALEVPEWSPTEPERQNAVVSKKLLSMICRLQSEDALVRKDGLLELAELVEEARPALSVIRLLLTDSDAMVRAHAAWAICRISGPDVECLQTLASVLQSDDPGGAPFAAYCLGLLESEATPVISELQSACDSELIGVRLCAAEALLKVTPEAAEPVAVLFEVLREAESKHRWLAALALSAVSGEYQDSAVLALIPLLEDADSDASASAALALGAFGAGAGSATPHLESLLIHPDADVREAASAALACIAR